MPKTIYDDRYGVFLHVLRKAREDSGRRQADVAAALRLGQATVSKIETGERRIDVIELTAYCEAIGTQLSAFIIELERELGRHPSGSQRRSATKRK